MGRNVSGMASWDIKARGVEKRRRVSIRESVEEEGAVWVWVCVGDEGEER